MDFTLLGTAVRFDNLPAGPEPVIATVPALEFVRLLEMGIVPTGLAVGAHYEWLQQSQKGPNLATGGMSGYNTPLTELTNFWEKIRRAAHAELRSAGAKQGNGVLANVHFGELLCPETSVKQPVQYLGRHIVIGAVIDTSSRASVPRGVRIVPPAEGEPRFDQPCTERRGRKEEENGVFLHFCADCGAWGSYGYGANLRGGHVGRWFCSSHRPQGSYT